MCILIKYFFKEVDLSQVLLHYLAVLFKTDALEHINETKLCRELHTEADEKVLENEMQLLVGACI